MTTNKKKIYTIEIKIITYKQVQVKATNEMEARKKAEKKAKDETKIISGDFC